MSATADAPAAFLAERRARNGPPIDAPGVYAIPFDAYLAHPALSKSKMVKLLECPAAYQYDLEHPEQPKDVWDFGRAAHTILLGAGDSLKIVEAEAWNDKGAAAAKADARAEGLVPLLERDFRKAKAMVAEVRRHPIASRLFNVGRPEQSLFWVDRETGVQMRARVDWLGEVGSYRLVMGDYKTSKAVDLWTIERAIADYAYHMQGAHYIDGVTELGIGDENTEMIFVFQSKTPPYFVHCVQLTAHTLRLGRARIRRALQIYLECLRDDRWPAYPDTSYAALPGWAARRDEEQFLSWDIRHHEEDYL